LKISYKYQKYTRFQDSNSVLIVSLSVALLKITIL
jgi:hypothetical protein